MKSMTKTKKTWLRGILAMAVAVTGAGCGVETAAEGGLEVEDEKVGRQQQELVGVDAVSSSPFFTECVNSGLANTQLCNLMAHYTCTSRGYASGWFRGDQAQYASGLHLGVNCVTTPVVGVDAIPGDPHYATCVNGGKAYARDCALMAHYTCIKRGYASGWFRGDQAQYASGLHLGLMCTSSSVGFVDVPPSSPHYSACFNSGASNIQACNLMANNTCVNAGYTGGWYRGDQAQYASGLNFGATCVRSTSALPPTQPSGVCSVKQDSGNDSPFSRDYNLYKTSGTFSFRREALDIKDRFVVSYQGSVLYDSGCVSGSTTVSLPYSGSSTFVNVTVHPNCEGTSGTAWNFTVGCP